MGSDKWNHRPGIDPQDQLRDLGNALGIQNLNDVKFEPTTGILTIFTDEKKYQVTLTEAP